MRIEEERERRLGAYRVLQSQANERGAIEPKAIREVGAYGGAQGIWVDKGRTASLTPSGIGVTVGILHTGDSYPDDLADDCLIYHYPETARPKSRDAGEVAATKAAKDLRLPIFVVTYAPRNSGRRIVKLGWVDDWDDDSAEFLITLSEEPPSTASTEAASVPDEEPFTLHETGSRAKREVAARLGQPRFKFRVFKRYGASCAACGISLLEVLDAAHLVSKRARGSDDPRNGIVLCSLHHRAFDAGLFGVEPESLEIRFRKGGPGASDLRITRTDLLELKKRPHPDALQDRWKEWESQSAHGHSRDFPELAEMD